MDFNLFVVLHTIDLKEGIYIFKFITYLSKVGDAPSLYRRQEVFVK